jgi:hypothetical protein
MAGLGFRPPVVEAQSQRRGEVRLGYRPVRTQTMLLVDHGGIDPMKPPKRWCIDTRLSHTAPVRNAISGEKPHSLEGNLRGGGA